MTLYVNPVRRPSRRRMIEDMMRDWDEDYTVEITFPIDVKAETESFTIKALLPGVNPEDLDIQIVNEIVTIAGELKADREEGETYLLTERPSGRFHRVLTLPTPLNADKVEADLENGVLILVVPKAEEAKPHTIKIKQK
ncbi:MAG: Hsp20/alpha crystallin family protein [Anaerolineaceae bacterium]|nr:Hsp20/alpha crystallin family protein [Anaerolineaceae bacterium]